ncbi:MAG: Lipid 3-O-deacylase-related protein [Edaphobacter sp.]|nr:Lipid 3-O-deacylase-related protein [Edaphobacter sp.]
MKLSTLIGLASLCLAGSFAQAQASDSRASSRRNTFAVFVEYSNDSSHILLGIAQNRKLAALGASYARRLWASRVGDLRYLVEVRPVLMESDPVNHSVVTVTPIVPVGPPTTYKYDDVPYLSCTPGNFHQTFQSPSNTVQYDVTVTCDRRWSFAQGLSPIGLQYSLRRGHSIQPFVSSTAGYIFSTRPIPTTDAGSFNFTFDFGVGVEFFQSRMRSIQAEYRYHHISNHDTANANPGIDNGVFKLSYAFGR